MKSFPQQPTPVPPQVEIPQDFPAIPQEIVDRFPEATRDWQRKLDDFWTRTNQAIQQAQDQTAKQVNSNVVFTVDTFKIYVNGTPTLMFSVDSSGVKLGNVLVIDTPGNKIFIGAGNLANDDTPFYIDTLGNFSLGASLVWDPDTDTLTITGVINATSGTIGGFDIGSDYIRDTGNSMGLASTVTGGNDLRFWAGATFANRNTAPFRVYEDGTLFSTLGNIGGFAISTTALTSANGLTLNAGSPPSISLVDSGVASLILQPNGVLLLDGASANLAQLSNTGSSGLLILYGSAPVVSLTNGGQLLIGDTNLYRSAANTLKTDDSFIADGSIAGSSGVFSLSANAASNVVFARNTSGGTAASARFTLGNDVSAASATFQSYSSAHATLPNYASLFNERNAPLLIGVNGTEVFRVISTGLSITGGLTVSGLAGVGTRNVVVDASGVMSAP